MATRLFLMGFSIVVLLSSCEQESNLGAPRKFFSKNMIGGSADYAVIKLEQPR